LRKIKTQFIVSWAVTLFLIICLFIFQIVQLKGLGRDYEIRILLNQKLINLSSGARKIMALMENYIFNFDAETIVQLRVTSGEFTDNLKSIHDHISTTPESLFLQRTTVNMLENMLHNAENQEESENRYNFYFDPWLGIRKQGEFFIVQTDKLALSMLEKNSLFTYQYSLRANERSLVLIMFLALLVLIIVFIFTINGRRMLADLKNINDYAKKLLERNFNIDDIPKSTYLEINNIGTTLDELKHDSLEKKILELHYNDEKIKNLEKDLLMREVKFRTLQMQINPHFLFNTLNMISRSAMLEDHETTIELIEAIATIMRYALTKEKLDIFQNELASLSSYIKIQRIRFQDTIDFMLKIETSDDVSMVQIPPLIIQPIVENAIVHGVSNISCRGLVEICIFTEPAYAVITVTDNGKGMEKSQLDRLAKEISAFPDLNISGIGLVNVAQRLHLFFNRPGLFCLESEINRGTRVIIRIPRETGAGK
jgi:sensor histidine kinase YesM